MHHPFSAIHSLPAANSAPNVAVHSSVITSTTSEMLDQTRRTFSKADMSINNLINPSPGKEPNSATKKRKADELENDDEETMMENAPEDTVPVVINFGNSPPPVASTIPVVVNTKTVVEQVTEEAASLNKEAAAATSSQTVAMPTSRAGEPLRKKQRTAAARALFFGAGVLAGGIATLGTLISLPDGYFQ